MLLIGKSKEGKRILDTVKNQLYSSKIAKDAEIELKQNAILEEDGFQIKEEMNKEWKYSMKIQIKHWFLQKENNICNGNNIILIIPMNNFKIRVTY